MEEAASVVTAPEQGAELKEDAQDCAAPAESLATMEEPEHPSDPIETKPEKTTVEIRISLAPDDADVLKILSALKLHETPRAAPSHDPPHALPVPVDLNLRAPSRDEALTASKRCEAKPKRLLSPFALLAALALGFVLRTQMDVSRLLDAAHRAGVATGTMVDKIIGAESHGSAAAKNQYSSALGPGQFVEATWLDLIRRHRPELAGSLSEREILDLRKDPELSRFMTSRYVEENTTILTRKGLPVTPGSLYLAHFAGPGGAVAILTAPENADAAAVIANVDSRPGITREKIVSGNPFLKNFTAKDLRNWADIKMMQGLTLVEGEAKAPPRRDL